MPGLLDTSNYLNTQISQLQRRGDDLANPYSQTNQSNRQYMSQQFGASQPNYFEIAASQGVGGGISAMQAAAAKRQAGLLTGSQFGQMMGENQKTALGFYNAAQQGSEGLLNMQYQDKQREAELAEKKREYEDSKGSIWDDLLTTGLGVAGSVLGGPAGGAAGGLIGKWLGGTPKKELTTNTYTSSPASSSYGVMGNNQNPYGVSQTNQNTFAPPSMAGYAFGQGSWDPRTQTYHY